MIATDFLHVDTALIKQLYVLVSIEHGTRRIHLAGITANSDGAWTAQQARNLATALGGQLEGMQYSIRDRGGQFTDAFDAVFESADYASCEARHRRHGRTPCANARSAHYGAKRSTTYRS